MGGSSSKITNGLEATDGGTRGHPMRTYTRKHTEGDETWHTLPLGGIHGKIPCIYAQCTHQGPRTTQVQSSSDYPFINNHETRTKAGTGAERGRKWLTKKEAMKIKSSSEIVLAVAVVMQPARGECLEQRPAVWVKAEAS